MKTIINSRNHKITNPKTITKDRLTSSEAIVLSLGNCKLPMVNKFYITEQNRTELATA